MITLCIVTKLPPIVTVIIDYEGFSMETVSKINIPSKMLSKDNTCMLTVSRTKAKDLLQSHQGVPHKWRYRYLSTRDH